jgi:Zn-dependent protease with chaperone function
LSPQQRLSVLGHEFGHGVNGDSRHLLVVGTALETLRRLYSIVASPAAAADALDRLRTTEETLRPAISYQAAFPKRIHLWSKQREFIARIPERELERRRRLSAIAGHRVDSSHPPTQLRIELLRELPSTEPKIALTAQEVEAVERELAPAYGKIAVELAAPYRAAHYES